MAARFIGLFLLMSLFSCQPKPHVKWIGYTPQKLEEAQNSGKPVFMYFYAAWCKTCYDLKERTFSNSEVVNRLNSFAPVKVDTSYMHAKKVIDITSRFRVSAVPTVILLDPQGKERFRFQGFVSPKKLLSFIDQFQATTINA